MVNVWGPVQQELGNLWSIVCNVAPDVRSSNVLPCLVFDNIADAKLISVLRNGSPQSVTGYLGLALVFAWNSTLWEGFYCYFSGLFC